MITKIKSIKIIISVLLITNLPLNAQVFDNNDKKWEFNTGIATSITMLGNPSQVANQLAIDEHYLDGIANPKGLPIGVTGYMSALYKFNQRDSFGFEVSLGFNSDGGTSQVIMGSVVPNYVMDMIVDAGGTQETLDAMGMVYPRLTTENTMKGYNIDPKIKAVYKANGKKWSTQVSIGAAFLIPLSYYAHPSKDPSKYYIDGAPLEETGNPADSTDIGNIFGKYASWGIRPVSVPFPLRTSDGRHYMDPINVLADFGFRFIYGMGYFELSYASDFYKINNLKMMIGVAFQSGKKDFDLLAIPDDKLKKQKQKEQALAYSQKNGMVFVNKI